MKYFCALILALGLLGCSSNSLPGPDSALVSEAIDQEFEKYIDRDPNTDMVKIKTTDILAAENKGDSVNQIIHGRFEAKSSFSVPLYELAETIADPEVVESPTQIVSITTKKGKSKEISGVYVANLVSSTKKKKIWNVELNFDDNLTEMLGGLPLSSFNNPIENNGSEVKRIRKKIKKVARERAKKEKEMELKKASFYSNLEGTWQSTNSFTNKDSGKGYYMNLAAFSPKYVCDGPAGFGLKLNVPEVSSNKVAITGSAYWTHRPDKKATISGWLVVNDNVDGVTITIDKSSPEELQCKMSRKTTRTVLFPGSAHGMKQEFSGEIIEKNMKLRWNGSGRIYEGDLEKIKN